jgi:putative DNA methylase
MAIYSRYSKVLESSGDRLTVRTALALINQVLDEVLAEQEGDYDADTRWSLKWYELFSHGEGSFSDANTLATAMSIGINGLVETGIVQAKGGKVRLLKRPELMSGRPETWDPATDTDIVHWEVCQYLIHALDTKGEAGAAALLRRINARYPGAAETARELAYRLYTICERKKWAQEAMAYNSLIVAWPEIVKLAQSSDGSGGEAQTTMF